MKKITFLLLIFTILSCSSDDKNYETKNIPAKFDIKLVIKSTNGSSPRTSISINSSQVKQWNDINLPFEGSYTYFTNGDETKNNACKCITISAWAYLSKLDNIESFDLYVDGKIVKTTNVIVGSTNGILNPTILEFVYNP